MDDNSPQVGDEGRIVDGRQVLQWRSRVVMREVLNLYWACAEVVPKARQRPELLCCRHDNT